VAGNKRHHLLLQTRRTAQPSISRMSVVDGGFLHKQPDQSVADFCKNHKPSLLHDPIAWIYASSPLHHSSNARHTTDTSVEKGNAVLMRLKASLVLKDKKEVEETKKKLRENAVEELCLIAKDEGNTWFVSLGFL
jgi:hypothetical protein